MTNHSDPHPRRLQRGVRLGTCLLGLLPAGCAHTPPRSAERVEAAAQARQPRGASDRGIQQSDAPVTPLVDHHKHLMSGDVTSLISTPVLAPVSLPDDLSNLLRERARKWNDRAALAELYADSGVVHDTRVPAWIRGGRQELAAFVSDRFGGAYRITPVAYRVDAVRGYVAGYFTRGDGALTRHFGHVHLSLERGGDRVWRIAAETLSFPGPATEVPVTAEQVIAELDAAGVRRGVVLSIAYLFGSPALAKPIENEYARVRAENDWVARETARFPGRLVAFCSFNPLKDYALQELERCAKSGAFRGLKLHFGNSGVDIRNPQHLRHVQQIFRAANRHRLAVVAHLWLPGGVYGREHAEIFLNRVLPTAPDITVQIAHFAGSGPGYTEPALAVLADAVAAGDPRTRRLYFDVATVADRQSDEVLQRFAERIRQIGPARVLFGSDMARPNGNPPARQSWLIFRTTVPLTQQEFGVIAANVAPYLR